MVDLKQTSYKDTVFIVCDSDKQVLTKIFDLAVSRVVIVWTGVVSVFLDF